MLLNLRIGVADLLQRLQQAIPRAEAWIEELLAAHQPHSVRVRDTGCVSRSRLYSTAPRNSSPRTAREK